MSESTTPGTGASSHQSISPTKRKRSKRDDRGAFVDHIAAMAFLDSRVNVERTRPDKVDNKVWKLDRTRALLKELGNPHEGLDIIHIAGSKGKGSVCNMLECTLQACGFTVGVFTSPHLLDVRERVRVGSEPVGEALFDRVLEQCRDAALTIEPEHGKATYFELLTALSLVVFSLEAVDLVVLETGIGGRLDCTNVVSPIICGLTSIHLEHTQILGDTLEAIAEQKAGIIKPGVLAVSVPQDEAVAKVFRSQADKVDAPIKVLRDEVLYSRRFQSGTNRGPHARVCVGEENGGFEHISVPLMGMHQADNCGLALAILLELREMGYKLPERQIIAGLEQINHQGRLEQIMERPRVFIDGAHTPESIRETLKAVGAHIDYDSLIIIFGCASDKDFVGMLGELERGADKVLFTKANGNPRAMNPDDLLSHFHANHSVMAEAKSSVKDAINGAAAAISGHDLILLLGSFFIAGEAKELVKAKAAKQSKHG